MSSEQRPWKHLYGKRWQRERRHFLAFNPLCRYCIREGRLMPAEVVDHVRPHKGDTALFWNRDNWQALCKRHHDGRKQVEEKLDARPATHGADGYPLDGSW